LQNYPAATLIASKAVYEENERPLPAGDASFVFAEPLAEIKNHAVDRPADELSPDNVVRWADTQNQPHFVGMCRRLLLPGSGIVGLPQLRRLVELAGGGSSCLLCLNHRSNFDVPTLDALLEDQSEPELFGRIIWLAGRKLEEDVGMTRLLVQCVNRVIVTPHSWFASPHSEDEIHQARCVNIAAERAVARLRYEGWVFGLFPTGTRIRPDDESTRQAIEQTDSYLRLFDYLLLGNIDGCTLPVSKDRDLTHETPRLDRMLYTFGEVQRTEDWREAAAARFPDLDCRMATATAIREDIDALAPARPD
jgi:hypothetical protein